MHKRKYFVLLPFALIIGIFLLFCLPPGNWFYVFLVPIVFWLIYYSWIYLEKRKN
ncbi:hypothetical protein J14TS2_28290 [Bacillus sp. J14TS2]|nr:hypothetical protein J14TS2_28290 [Bacillus sp. J14TS2]